MKLPQYAVKRREQYRPYASNSLYNDLVLIILKLKGHCVWRFFAKCGVARIFYFRSTETTSFTSFGLQRREIFTIAPREKFYDLLMSF